MCFIVRLLEEVMLIFDMEVCYQPLPSVELVTHAVLAITSVSLVKQFVSILLA